MRRSAHSCTPPCCPSKPGVCLVRQESLWQSVVVLELHPRVLLLQKYPFRKKLEIGCDSSGFVYRKDRLWQTQLLCLEGLRLSCLTSFVHSKCCNSLWCKTVCLLFGDFFIFPYVTYDNPETLSFFYREDNSNPHLNGSLGNPASLDLKIAFLNTLLSPIFLSLAWFSLALERICHFISRGSNSCVEAPPFPSAVGLQLPAEAVPVCPSTGQLKLQELNPALCGGRDGTDSRGRLWCKLTLFWLVPSFLSGALNKRKSEPVPCSAKLEVRTCGQASGVLCRGSLWGGK